MYFAGKYIIAYGLDLIFGDPEFLYHPVRAIGKLIKILEDRLYDLENKRFAGGILVFITLVVTFFISYIFSFFTLTEIYFLYTTLATKCLGDEGLKVYRILKLKDLEKAKKQLSYLVSRDTEEMDERQIIRSVIETISENTTDGVIAPMFFAIIGSFCTWHGVRLALPFAMTERQIIRSVIETISENTTDGVIAPMFFAIIGSFCTWHGVRLALPFAMTYKAINTIDSMIGYKNKKYRDFGTAGAKLDDLANFIPARLGGMIIVIGAFLLGYNYKEAFRIYKRDRLNHGSPNSGHSESCFAGALGLQFGGKTKYFGKVYDKPTIGDRKKDFTGLQFGGKTKYFGKVYDKPTIGDRKKDFTLEDILKARKLLYVSSFVGLVIFIVLSIIGNFLIKLGGL